MNCQEATIDVPECPVCYSVISADKNKCITACGHTYCMPCFIKCTAYSNKCSVCRGELYDLTEFAATNAPQQEVNVDDAENDDIMSISEITAGNTLPPTDYGNSIEYETFTNTFRSNGFTYEDLSKAVLYLLYIKNEETTQDVVNNIHQVCIDFTKDTFAEKREMDSMENEDMNALYDSSQPKLHSLFNQQTFVSVARNFNDFADEIDVDNL